MFALKYYFQFWKLKNVFLSLYFFDFLHHMHMQFADSSISKFNQKNGHETNENSPRFFELSVILVKYLNSHHPVYPSYFSGLKAGAL